jgi:hypothetical protein
VRGTLFLPELTMGRLRSRIIPALALSALVADSALAETGEGSVRVSGSFRLRYESFASPYPTGRQSSDALLNARTLVRTDYSRGGFRLTGELLDSRTLAARQDGRAFLETDTLEPIQLLGGWSGNTGPDGGGRIDVQIGRMTLDIGSRRLIARPNFRSVSTAFDGIHAAWSSPAGVRLEGFHLAPTRRLPDDRSVATDNRSALNRRLDGARLSGVHAALPATERVTGSAYVLILDETDRPGEAGRNRQLATWGARLLMRPQGPGPDFDIEASRQSGSLRASASALDVSDLDHGASMAHVEAGYRFDAAGRPRLSFHYDFASGDRSPTDGRSERFDPLYGDRSFEFGPTSLFGVISRSNLSSPGIRVEWETGSASDMMAMIRRIALDQPRDSFAASGLRDAAGASGREVGTQIEMRYRHRLGDGRASLEMGAAGVAAGRFLRATAGKSADETSVYIYSSATVAF